MAETRAERWEVCSYRPTRVGDATEWEVVLRGPQPRGLGRILIPAAPADALAEAVEEMADDAQERGWHQVETALRAVVSSYREAVTPREESE